MEIFWGPPEVGNALFSYCFAQKRSLAGPQKGAQKGTRKEPEMESKREPKWGPGRGPFQQQK